jgi:hypothetical protein
MIPIVSILNFITFLFTTLISYQLVISYIKNRDSLMKYFAALFIFLSIYFFFNSTPGIFATSISSIAFFRMFSTYILLIGLMFLVITPLRILGWLKVERIFLFLISISLIFIIFSDFKYPQPVKPIIFENFITWSPPGPVQSRIATGVTSLLTALFTAGFYLVNGFRRKDRFIFRRSLMLGMGTIFFALAGLVNYIAGAKATLYTFVGANIFSILGALLYYFAIVMKKPVEWQES